MKEDVRNPRQLRKRFVTWRVDQRKLREKQMVRCASSIDLLSRFDFACHANKGLVITEALYFPINDEGRPVDELKLDVTVPLQADVRDGQLYIAGGLSKVCYSSVHR